MPRSTQVPTVPISVSDTGLSPSLVWLSSQLLLPSHGSLPWVLQPRIVETTRFSLFPFRSPLLWESRLISFPLGTEMFHFPRSAPYKRYRDCSRWVPPFRHPRLIGYLAPPRGLSQLITSFIAFSAKASARCSYYLVSRKKPLFFPCSIVNDLAASAAPRIESRFEIPSLLKTSLVILPRVCLVEADRIELTTLCLQSRCSPY